LLPNTTNIFHKRKYKTPGCLLEVQNLKQYFPPLLFTNLKQFLYISHNLTLLLIFGVVVILNMKETKSNFFAGVTYSVLI
jgi:hypothetical protein